MAKKYLPSLAIREMQINNCFEIYVISVRIISNCPLNLHLCTHRLVHLSDLIRDVVCAVGDVCSETHN